MDIAKNAFNPWMGKGLHLGPPGLTPSSSSVVAYLLVSVTIFLKTESGQNKRNNIKNIGIL
jgi:hypothetical protein